MKKTILLLLLACNVWGLHAQQTDTSNIYRVGIFANLFMDSSFHNQTYRYNNQMPRHLLPGLDFTEGALLALDSIATSRPVWVSIYDIKSAGQTIHELKQKQTFDSLDLIIGAVSGTDYRQLSDVALQYQIPFLSATFPNDGGVTNNPFTIILNPTLPVHCSAIFNFIMQTEPTGNIIYLRKKGQQEDRLAGYFDTFNRSSKGGQLLKWKTISVKDSVKQSDFATILDSTKLNIVIAGSLDEKFAVQVVTSLHQFKKYPLQIMGMPTWEPMKELNQSPLKDMAVFYSTTFYNTGTPLFEHFTKKFTESTNGRPSDLAYKGYEITWNFVNLLLKHGDQLINRISDSNFELFTDYDLRPVINATTGRPDYFENKRVYIIKKQNGTTLKVGTN